MSLRVKLTACGLAVLAMCFQACAVNDKPLKLDTALTATDVNAFYDLYAREFHTDPDDMDNIIQDRRMAVSAPGLNGDWFYMQLNTGAAKTLYRQRMIRFDVSKDGQSLIQSTYNFQTPQTYENLWENPDVMAAMTMDDLEAYLGEGCQQTWSRKAKDVWYGHVDPKTCLIFSKRRDVDIRIEAEVRLSDNFYQTAERGYDLDNNFLWGTQPGEYITLRPVN